MAAKKTKAAIAVGPNGTKHTLATHVDEGLWRAFKDFREQRKENRNFPGLPAIAWRLQSRITWTSTQTRTNNVLLPYQHTH